MNHYIDKELEEWVEEYSPKGEDSVKLFFMLRRAVEQRNEARRNVAQIIAERDELKRKLAVFEDGIPTSDELRWLAEYATSRVHVKKWFRRIAESREVNRD